MKLVKNNSYLLLIDAEAEIKEGKTFITKDNIIHSNYGYNYGDRVVVAYYPLTKEAKELDLPLLPVTPRNKWGVHETHCCSKHGCKYGDNDCCVELGIAEQKYPCEFCSDEEQEFSLEDMKKAIEMAREQDCSNFEYYGFCEKAYTDDEIIQSLSTQQFPSEFIPEYEADISNSPYTSNKYNKALKALKESSKIGCKLKTMTNSEGKQELVGTYKY